MTMSIIKEFAKLKPWEDELACTIFRAGQQKRKLKSTHFDHEFISLGLYNRAGYGKLPTTKGDKFRLEVVTAFLNDLGKSAGDLDNICAKVVTNPRAMQALYHEVDNDIPENEVARVLTLDAIFLICIYGNFVFDFTLQFPSVFTTLRRQSLPTRSIIFQDCIQLENQIPLRLLQNVLELILDCGKHLHKPVLRQEADVSDIEAQANADSELHHRTGLTLSDDSIPGRLLHILCANVVGILYSLCVPGFNTAGSYVKSVDFVSCKHLLDCLYVAMCSRISLKQKPDDLPATRQQHRRRSWCSIVDVVCQWPFCRQQTIPPQVAIVAADMLKRHEFPEGQHVAPPGKEIIEANPAPRDILKELIKANLLIAEAPILPSATRLAEAGIEFRGRQAPTGNVEFKVHMCKAVLYLPRMESLRVEYERIWRNIVAYEDDRIQRDSSYEFEEHGELLAYMDLLSDLIHTDKDVAMLKKGKHPIIAKNGAGLASDTAVANVFGSMLTETITVMCRPPKWAELRVEIYKYYDNAGRRSRVEFRRTYFGKWWFTISLLAAALLLVLTLLQTGYSGLSYYK